jgi:hypothetical protein
VTLFPDAGPFNRERYPKHMEFFTAGAHYKERLSWRLIAWARLLLVPTKRPAT